MKSIALINAKTTPRRPSSSRSAHQTTPQLWTSEALIPHTTLVKATGWESTPVSAYGGISMFKTSVELSMKMVMWPSENRRRVSGCMEWYLTQARISISCLIRYFKKLQKSPFRDAQWSLDVNSHSLMRFSARCLSYQSHRSTSQGRL